MSSLESDVIRISKWVAFRAQLARIMKLLFGITVALLIVYFCFALTLLRFVPSTSGTGVQLIKGVSAPGGFIQQGNQVLASAEQEQDQSWGNKLQTAFVPSDEWMLVEVVAGPYGELSVSEGQVTVDNRVHNVNINLAAFRNHGKYLSDEYIVNCISGACNPGQAMIIGKEYIAGEPVMSDNDKTYTAVVTPVVEEDSIPVFSERDIESPLDYRLNAGEEVRVVSLAVKGFVEIQHEDQTAERVFVHQQDIQYKE